MSEPRMLRGLKTTLKEIWGLFVEDGVFAASIVFWLASIWTASRFAWLPGSWLAPLLFAGLAVILFESATRYARGRRGGMRE